MSCIQPHLPEVWDRSATEEHLSHLDSAMADGDVRSDLIERFHVHAHLITERPAEQERRTTGLAAAFNRFAPFVRGLPPWEAAAARPARVGPGPVRTLLVFSGDDGNAVRAILRQLAPLGVRPLLR